MLKKFVFVLFVFNWNTKSILTLFIQGGGTNCPPIFYLVIPEGIAWWNIFLHFDFFYIGFVWYFEKFNFLSPPLFDIDFIKCNLENLGNSENPEKPFSEKIMVQIKKNGLILEVFFMGWDLLELNYSKAHIFFDFST